MVIDWGTQHNLLSVWKVCVKYEYEILCVANKKSRAFVFMQPH